MGYRNVFRQPVPHTSTELSATVSGKLPDVHGTPDSLSGSSNCNFDENRSLGYRIVFRQPVPHTSTELNATVSGKLPDVHLLLLIH
ncbi:MAG: hypothetical protein U5K72_11210 [Balneolaceae bacterium]|nr:hypothetical protein [Balneolaceae bacterium]